MPPRQSVVGNRYTRLVVLREVKAHKNHRYVYCRCDCGVEKTIALTCLRSYTVKSCGCLKKQRAVETHTKHGNGRNGCQSHAYRCWHNMKQRCGNTKSPTYGYYGGRGITFCDRWSNFAEFLQDVGEPPSSKHTLDRYPNNNGNYEPGNVRWATREEQGLNTRANRLITFNGETKPLTAWARTLQIPIGRLRGRLNLGWPVAEAFTAPPHHRIKRR